MMADEDGGRLMSRLQHGKIIQVIHWRGGLLALDDDGTSPSAPAALEADPVTPAVVMMSDRELERRLHEQAPLPKNPQDPIPKTLVYQVGELRRIAKITCYEAMQRDQPMAIRLAGAGLVMPRRLMHSGDEDGGPVEIVVRWASGRPARPLHARAGEEAGEVEA